MEVENTTQDYLKDIEDNHDQGLFTCQYQVAIEKLKECSYFHCKSYTSQRNYINKLVEEAQQARKQHGNDPQYRQDIFVADYSQNIPLPYFGSDQPAESFLTHLSLYVYLVYIILLLKNGCFIISCI